MARALMTLILAATIVLGCDTSTDSPALTDTTSDTVAPTDALADASTDAATDTSTASDTAADPDTEADSEDTATAPWPPFDPTVCGMTPYEWLPPSEVGAVVDVRPMEIFDVVPAALVNELLTQAGYGTSARAQYDVRNYRMRYVTQDKGQLVEATALLGVPIMEDTSAPLPLGAWLHHSVGFVDECAATRDLAMGALGTVLIASRGYVAVEPDYIGLIGYGDPSPEGSIHPYLVGEPTALASLDSLRAAVRALADMPEEAQPDTSRVFLVGGSQGGHAAFFVDRYAPHYAPELTIVAAAAAVPPTDILALAQDSTASWDVNSRVLLTALGAMRHWYGTPEDMSGVLTDTEPYHLATDLETYMASRCGFEIRLDGVDELTDLYEEDFLAAASTASWDDIEPWSCFLRESSLSHTSVPHASDTPFFAAYAENDDLVIVDAQREDFLRLCDNGYRIEYVECAGMPHTEGGRATAPLLLDWIDRRLAGEPWNEADYCQVHEPVDCEAAAATLQTD